MGCGFKDYQSCVKDVKESLTFIPGFLVFVERFNCLRFD